MENRVENRVTEGLLDWTDKENRLRAVFGSDVIKGRDFLQSKRDFFNNLYRSCKADASPEERIMLNVIRGEARKLDKLIYPSRIIRLIVNITNKVKEGIQAYRENRSLKDEMLSIRLKNKPVDYSKSQNNAKVTENKNQLRESAKAVLDTYKKKGVKTKSQQSENHSRKNEDSLLPKKRVNNNNGRSIY